MSIGAEKWRKSVDAANNSHCARVLGIETTAGHFAQRPGDFVARMKGVKVWKNSELSNDFHRANKNLIGHLSGKNITVVKRRAEAPLAVSIFIAESRSPSSEFFVVVLDEKVDRNCSAKATLSRDFVDIENKIAFKNL